MQAVQVPPGFDADNAPNAEDVEQGFAVLAVKHLETYWGILNKVKGSALRLTKFDDDIMEDLHKTFPDFDPAKPLDEDEMKSPEGKEKWRNFMMAYSKKVDDYNFGTIVRTRADGEYTNEGTIFVPRMQFYAIEIARNRAGLNDWVYEQAQKK
ncbi:putative polysaccharide biosynthesis protein [Podospora conica]|nr:putative polysaccharide biosynthesis protein [Schizothecium conicum]